MPRSFDLPAVKALIRDDRVRYLLVGGLTSAIYYGLFVTGWLALHGVLHYLVVTAIAHITTALLVYPLYRNVVFRSDSPWLIGFVRFYTVFLGGMIASLVGMPLLIEIGNVPALVAQAVIIALVPVLSYVAHRFWTFKPRGEVAGEEGERLPAR